MTEERAEEEPRVVVRDRRKIDPETGLPRQSAEPAAEPDQPSASPTGDAEPAGSEPEQPVADAAPAAGSVEAELAERTNDLQRVTAEYANYRRRSERDRTAAAEAATAKLVTTLLPVLDDLDRAREHGDLSGTFGAVAEKLTTALTAAGVSAFGEKGDPFDPNRHEAVMHAEADDITVSTCVQVLRPGYVLGERLVRPAMVAVADPVNPAPPADADPAAEPVSGDAETDPES